MHGQYPERVGKPDINQDNTHQWLRNSGLKAETEGFIIAAQDQSLPTKLYQHRIINNGSDPKCRMCHNCDEQKYGTNISPTQLLKMNAPSYGTCQYTLIVKLRQTGLTSL